MQEILQTVKRMEREFYYRNQHYYKVVKDALKTHKDMREFGNKTDFRN